ncbi:unnamed protein product [Amaranthus hypochondriacus]
MTQSKTRQLPPHSYMIRSVITTDATTLLKSSISIDSFELNLLQWNKEESRKHEALCRFITSTVNGRI